MQIGNILYTNNSFKQSAEHDNNARMTNIIKYDNSALNLEANYKKAAVHFGHKPDLDIERLESLNIPNMHITGNSCVRGESLSSPKNRKFIMQIKKAGIEDVIDLRDKYASTVYQDLCGKNNLNYHNIPVDAGSIPDRDIIDKLPELFELMNKGRIYIACAMGLHRTDIALALNYIFNPKKQDDPPLMYGHFKENGFKRDDISRRINSVKKALNEADLRKLGWKIEDFETETLIRKKELFDFNEKAALQ